MFTLFIQLLCSFDMAKIKNIIKQKFTFITENSCEKKLILLLVSIIHSVHGTSLDHIPHVN